MARPTSDLPNDVTVYLVLNDYRTGLAYVETALDEADRDTVIRNLLSGQYSNALRVVASTLPKGGLRMCPRTSLTRYSIEPTTPTVRSPKLRSASLTGT
jgi:hypothetical protein